MFIQSIQIENFRNIKSEIFFPSENINILFGENANGKTSFIEAIYAVSNLKSFKTLNLYETINTDENTSSIKCNFYKNLCKESIFFNIKKSTKSYLKNEKKCSLDDYLWSLLSIVFKPDDINIVNGSPGLRREFLDKAIFYTDKNYIKIVKKYLKILTNKNQTLKNENYTNLDEWNFLLAKYSALITFKRLEYLNRINEVLINKCKIFKNTFSLNSNYNEYFEDLENYFLNEIKINKNKEIKYKYSLIGSHREEINIKIDNKELKVFGSQGQKRTFILLFRSSQIDDFYNNNNFYPILLLDDMASELDEKNINVFFDLINNFSGQTFITTTDKNLFSNNKKVKSFRVHNGKIAQLHK